MSGDFVAPFREAPAKEQTGSLRLEMLPLRLEKSPQRSRRRGGVGAPGPQLIVRGRNRDKG